MQWLTGYHLLLNQCYEKCQTYPLTQQNTLVTNMLPVEPKVIDWVALCDLPGSDGKNRPEGASSAQRQGKGWSVPNEQ